MFDVCFANKGWQHPLFITQEPTNSPNYAHNTAAGLASIHSQEMRSEASHTQQQSNTKYKASQLQLSWPKAVKLPKLSQLGLWRIDCRGPLLLLRLLLLAIPPGIGHYIRLLDILTPSLHITAPP